MTNNCTTLKNKTAEIFIPDNVLLKEAFRRTTHMGIGAHQDDIEILAYDGILKCFGKQDCWFFGVTVTDGSGTPRDGIYSGFSEGEIKQVRRKEQRKAAYIGEYSAVAMLDYPSSVVKDYRNSTTIEDLLFVLASAGPRVVYTHSLWDRHDTHVAVALRTIEALRKLPDDLKPKSLYGVEVWRDLDWMLNDDKIFFDVSGHDNMARALMEVFDSQNCGNKRYDKATVGRRTAHATFAKPHYKDDDASSVIYGVDMTPLIYGPDLSIMKYSLGYIDRFKNDVQERIKRLDKGCHSFCADKRF